eukprot:1194495-Prorocentrum_minimum.AAC.2
MWAGKEDAKLDKQASTEVVWGTAGGGGRTAPGASLASEVPGARDASRQNQGSTRQAPPG